MNDEQLHQVLHEWKADTPVSPGFRANVWERIVARQDAHERTPLALLRGWLMSLMLQPARVAVLGAVVLALGIGAGWWSGSQDRVEEWSRLEARYVQSIDPYARTHTLAPR